MKTRGNFPKLLAILKELGVKPDWSSYQDRIMVRNIAYLSELLGVKQGYAWCLNIRGVYSYGLFEDAIKLGYWKVV